MAEAESEALLSQDDINAALAASGLSQQRVGCRRNAMWPAARPGARRLKTASASGLPLSGPARDAFEIPELDPPPPVLRRPRASSCSAMSN